MKDGISVQNLKIQNLKSSMLAAIFTGLLGVTGAQAATVVAEVNSRPITDRDVKDSLGGMNEGQRESFLKDPTSRQRVVDSLISQEVLFQEGERAKFDQEPAYQEAIKAFRRQYLIGKVLEKNLAPKLTDKAAKKYYDSNKMLFSTDRVQVQHILLADEATAKDVLKKAKAADADFQELAEKLSKDPSAKNNRGELGVITRDAPFVKEFKDAAFGGSIGDIVGPVKTVYGYHLIKVVDKKIGKALEYDEVELRVKSELRDQLIQNLTGELRAKAKVDLKQKAIETL